MKKTKKGLLIWFAAVLLATMFVPVSAKAASKKNASDAAALRKIISAQNAAGGSVDKDLDSASYEWEKQKGEYRLVRIHWGEGITGSVSLAGFAELKGFECMNTSLTSLDISKNEKLELLLVGQNKLSKLDVSKNTN